MSVTQEILDKLKLQADMDYQSIKDEDETGVIVHYNGDLSAPWAGNFSVQVEKSINEKIPDKQARKRFFSVYLEAIQNIRHHAVSDEQGRTYGAATIFSKPKHLCAKFYNIVTNEQAVVLNKRYSEVNALERSALKERYMEIMVNGEISDKGGAGLGIITMVLRSKNPCTIHFAPLTADTQVFQSEICVDLE